MARSMLPIAPMSYGAIRMMRASCEVNDASCWIGVGVP